MEVMRKIAHTAVRTSFVAMTTQGAYLSDKSVTIPQTVTITLMRPFVHSAQSLAIIVQVTEHVIPITIFVMVKLTAPITEMRQTAHVMKTFSSAATTLEYA